MIAEELCDSVNYFFYDYHALVGVLFGDKRAAADKLQSRISEQYTEYDDGHTKDYNNMVVKKVGQGITKGILAFAAEASPIIGLRK